MTTIAYRDGVLASDSRICREGLILSDKMTKIWKLTDGSLFGGSGIPPFIATYRDWLQGGRVEKRPPLIDKECWSICVQIHLGGRVELHEEGGSSILPSDIVFGCGSGRDFAIAAMDFGRSVADAVSYAMTRDPGSGGAVQILALER